MEWTVELDDGEVVVGELRLEKALRIVDVVAELTRSNNEAADVLQGWVERERERRRRELQAFMDEGGQVETYAPLEPTGWERFLQALPYVWRSSMRSEIDTLLAVACADLGDMEAADANGVLDPYLAAIGRRVRFHGGLRAAREILQLLAQRVQQEIAEQGTLGEVAEGFSESLAGIMGALGSSDESEPAGSTASPPTTAGPDETSSTASPSQSSATSQS